MQVELTLEAITLILRLFSHDPTSWIFYEHVEKADSVVNPWGKDEPAEQLGNLYYRVPSPIA